QAQRAPFVVERGEEVAGATSAVFAQEAAVGQQRQRPPAGGQEQVPASLRAAGGGGFEQQRVAPGRQPLQRQQVAAGVEGAGEQHGARRVRRGGTPGCRWCRRSRRSSTGR